MGNSETRLFHRRMAAVFTAFVVAVAILLHTGYIVFADEAGYYKTWDAYKESGQPASTWNDVVDAMEQVLDYGIDLYAQGDTDGAYKTVSDAYYGYYETTGFERIAMGYISGARKSEMELQFSACKSVAKNKGSEEDYNQEVETLKSMLREDANQLDGVTGDDSDSESDSSSEESGSSDSSSSTSGQSRSAAAATFIACFSIILREGFEAILIVGAIIAYLVKSAGEDKKKRKKLVYPVYWGSLAGIALSFVLAWLLNILKLANSASQEIIEGVTALTAVLVLYYVSNWMLSKSETDAWTKYIKSKAQESTKSGSTFALAFTAFLAVFREGAEVVLFFQPMLAGDNISSVWMGLIIGFVCLIFVYIAINLLSLRIPIKPFFVGTSILMFIMSISFLGAGIKELIEGDVLTMTSPDWLSWIPSNSLMEVLGIYPCLQTLIPQLILLIITIVVFVIQTKKNRAIHAEAEKKREAERLAKEEEEKKAQEAQLRRLIREIVLEVLAESKNADAGSDASQE
ncbi:MAG: FTR1 family iron permease [Lachnospiraceae bacterium]|nr:FTR1 family iron permease [Lachnospiraceae bacterium]